MRNLAIEKFTAIRRFIRCRKSIPGRATPKHVANVDVFAALDPTRFDDVIQQLAGSAHEWFSLLILVGARGLPNEHDLRIGISHAEHSLSSRRSQFGAACALSDSLCQCRKARNALGSREVKRFERDTVIDAGHCRCEFFLRHFETF